MKIELDISFRYVIVTSATGSISDKPRLEWTVERSLGVITEGQLTTVVSYQGTLVDI